MQRRHFPAALAALAGWGTAGAAAWAPHNRVEYVIPAAAGGAVDIYGRVMKKILDASGALGGQSFVISNRPGGSGMIAAAPLLQRPGDAHIFSMLSTGFMLGQVLGQFKHDLLRDFTVGPIFFEEALAVAVRADSPFKSATDLVAQLRRDPGSVRIAVAPNLLNHIHIGLLKPLAAAGVDMDRLTVAAFRASSESVVALMGGHVDVVSSSAANVVEGVRNGSLRALAVSSEQRLKGTLAQVPTWKEQGVNAAFTSVQGVYFPKDLSAAQIAFWDAQFQRMAAAPEWLATLAQYEVTPRFMNHAQASAYVRNEISSATGLLRELKLLK